MMLLYFALLFFGALCAFLILAYRGRLDMMEQPKHDMLHLSESHPDLVIKQSMVSKESSEIHYHEAGQIAERVLPIPIWLRVLYFVIFAIGLFTLCYYIQGSHGWLDRGAWQSLQEASKT